MTDLSLSQHNKQSPDVVTPPPPPVLAEANFARERNGLGEIQTGTSAALSRDILPIHEYLDFAKHAPSLYMPNSPAYFANAIKAYGHVMVSNYGEMVPHYKCLDAEWMSEGQTQRRIPRDVDDFVQILLSKLEEAGRQPRIEKGFMIHGVPGSGKDTVIRRLLETVEHFSEHHPLGVIYRLGFRFDGERDSRKILRGFAGDNQQEPAKSRGYIISSPSNCNPVFVLSNKRQVDFSGSRSPELSEREKFVSGCLKADPQFNKEYVLSNDMDPMSSEIFKALVKYYDGDTDKVMKNHVIAERYACNINTGEGIYIQLPSAEPNSHAAPLLKIHPLTDQYIPKELEQYARKIPEIHSQSASLKILYKEDAYSGDRSPEDLSTHSHENARIERGDLQMRSEDFSLTIQTDTVVINSTNPSHLDLKRHSPNWESASRRYHFIAQPCIRQFREEIEAHRAAYNLSLGDKTVSCPHVLETLCLFLTATRLLNPRPENYARFSRKSSENLGEIAARLKGVRKALFFQRPEFTERNEDLNILAQSGGTLLARDIKILRAHEPLIKKEYLADIEKSRADIYDGGFGISTSNAKVLINDLTNSTRGSKYISVLDLINVLTDAYEEGFEYYQNFLDAKNRHLIARYKTLCREENIEALNPAEFEQKGGKNSQKQLALFQKATNETNERFPISSPKELLDDVTTYARFKVQQDIYSALKIFREDIKDRINKYIFHAVSFTSKGAIKIPDKYITTKREFRSGQQASGEVDEEFMRMFEKDYGDITGIPQTRIGDFRQDLVYKVSSWHSENKKNNPGTSTHLTDHLSELHDTDFIREIAKVLRANQAGEIRTKIRNFWADCQKYHEKPAVFKQDLDTPATRERATGWQEAWTGLQDMGYHQDSLFEHINWAFEGDLKE